MLSRSAEVWPTRLSEAYDRFFDFEYPKTTSEDYNIRFIYLLLFNYSWPHYSPSALPVPTSHIQSPIMRFKPACALQSCQSEIRISSIKSQFVTVNFLFISVTLFYFFIYFLKDFIYLFLERGREGEKHRCVVASLTPPTVDLACNPGMCPDWESNR